MLVLPAAGGLRPEGGFVHGPAPGAAEASMQSSAHDEYAVMVDTFRPLSLGAALAERTEPAYHLLGWARPAPGPAP